MLGGMTAGVQDLSAMMHSGASTCRHMALCSSHPQKDQCPKCALAQLRATPINTTLGTQGLECNAILQESSFDGPQATGHNLLAAQTGAIAREIQQSHFWL